jgi:uncharacterized protein YcbX
MTIRIEQIYRYPVKGMRAEQLHTGTLEAGGGLALDRAFAFTSGNLPPPAGRARLVALAHVPADDGLSAPCRVRCAG